MVIRAAFCTQFSPVSHEGNGELPFRVFLYCRYLKLNGHCVVHTRRVLRFSQQPGCRAGKANHPKSVPAASPTTAAEAGGASAATSICPEEWTVTGTAGWSAGSATGSAAVHPASAAVWYATTEASATTAPTTAAVWYATAAV